MQVVSTPSNMSGLGGLAVSPHLDRGIVTKVNATLSIFERLIIDGQCLDIADDPKIGGIPVQISVDGKCIKFGKHR